jgi:hypothetical protein
MESKEYNSRGEKQKQLKVDLRMVEKAVEEAIAVEIETRKKLPAPQLDEVIDTFQKLTSEDRIRIKNFVNSGWRAYETADLLKNLSKKDLLTLLEQDAVFIMINEKVGTQIRNSQEIFNYLRECGFPADLETEVFEVIRIITKRIESGLD